MSKTKKFYEDASEAMAAVIRSDLPDWPLWFTENEENGTLEDQIFQMMFEGKYNTLIFMINDLVSMLDSERKATPAVRVIRLCLDILKAEYDKL